MENYPSTWVEKFLEQKLYAWDPIHVASYATNLAFACSDVPDMIDLTKEQQTVLRSALMKVSAMASPFPPTFLERRTALAALLSAGEGP